MANAIELAKAYVQIVPSAQGIESSLASMLDKPATAAGKSAGNSIASGVKSALGTVGKVAAGALTAATGAATVFGKKAVEVGQEFDKSMSQVAATMGLTTDEIDDLREFAQQMGSETVFSATQAAQALNYMALAGYDAETSMQMLPNVLNLAAAGGMDLARASDMVTDTQTAFGISLERTSQMVDEMAKAASTGNTSVEQLGEAFLRIGGLAQELNGGMVNLADGTEMPVDNVQELAIALTAMANAGIKGAEAGTHMRNMLLKLASPTADGQLAFEKLGVSVFDAEGNMRSLSDLFTDLSGAMGQLTQQEKLQAISDIFNTRDTASAEALLAAVGEDWDKIGEAILQADGAAGKMAGTQLDNLAGSVTLFKSALEGAYIAVSDELTPALRKVVQFGASGMSKLTTAIKDGGLEAALPVAGELFQNATQSIVSYLPKLTAIGSTIFQSVLNGILGALPTLVSALPDFLSAFLSLCNSITNAIVLALPQFLTVVVQALPSLIPQLVEGIVMLLTLIPNSLTAIIDPLVQALPDILTALVTALFTNMPIVISALVQLAEKIVENLPAIMQAIWDAVLLAWNGWIAPALEEVGAFLGDIWNNIVEFFRPMAEWINTNVIQPISNFFSGMVRWIDEKVIQPVAGFFRGLWDGIVNAWNVVIGPWLEIARRAWMIISQGASEAWAKIKEVWNVVSTWFNTKIVLPVTSFFNGMWDRLKTAAKNAWTGIKNVFSPVVEWFKNVFQKAWEGVKNVFSAGGRIFTGIKEGIENVFKTVVNAIIKGINTVVAIPFNAINGFLDTLRNISILGVSPFSWIGNIGVPQIPLLAKGAVLTKPTLMVGGEAGAEAIVPLERNTEWIQSVAMEMEEATDESDLLEEILAKMDHLSVYLDSGKLVGGISTKMDGALGNNAGMRQRGVALA